jgi:hypothetical protein
MQCISLRPVIDHSGRPPDRPRGAPVLLEFAALLNHQPGLQRSTTACGRCRSRCSSRARPPWGQARFRFSRWSRRSASSRLFGSSPRTGRCLVVCLFRLRVPVRRTRGAPARRGRGRARHGCGARGRRRRRRQRQRAAVLRAARAGPTFSRTTSGSTTCQGADLAFSTFQQTFSALCLRLVAVCMHKQKHRDTFSPALVHSLSLCSALASSISPSESAASAASAGLALALALALAPARTPARLTQQTQVLGLLVVLWRPLGVCFPAARARGRHTTKVRGQRRSQLRGSCECMHSRYLMDVLSLSLHLRLGRYGRSPAAAARTRTQAAAPQRAARSRARRGGAAPDARAAAEAHCSHRRGGNAVQV